MDQLKDKQGSSQVNRLLVFLYKFTENKMYRFVFGHGHLCQCNRCLGLYSFVAPGKTFINGIHSGIGWKIGQSVTNYIKVVQLFCLYAMVNTKCI